MLKLTKYAAKEDECEQIDGWATRAKIEDRASHRAAIRPNHTNAVR
jgi:hypothetical protein